MQNSLGLFNFLSELNQRFDNQTNKHGTDALINHLVNYLVNTIQSEFGLFLTCNNAGDVLHYAACNIAIEKDTFFEAFTYLNKTLIVENTPYVKVINEQKHHGKFCFDNQLIVGIEQKTATTWLILANKKADFVDTDTDRALIFLQQLLKHKADIEIKTKQHIQFQKYRALADVSDVALFFSDKGYCIECNDRAQNMFGYNYDELIGMFGTDVIALEYRELVKDNMLQQYSLPYQALALKKDGTTFWSEIHGRMVEYNGKTVRLTSLRDISVQKTAEIEKINSEFEYQSLFKSMNDAYALLKVYFDSNNKVIDLSYEDVNPAFERMFNASKNKILKKSITEIWQQHAKSFFSHYDALLKLKTPIQFTIYSTILKRHFNINAHIPKKGLIAHSITDISEKVKATNEMQLHNKRLELLVRFSEYKPNDVKELIHNILADTLKFSACSVAYCGVLNKNGTYDLISTDSVLNEDSAILIDKISLEYTRNKHKCAASIISSTELNPYHFLSIPIIRNKKLELQFVIGSKDLKVINQDNLQQLVLLLESAWSIIDRQVHEDYIIEEKEKAKIFEYRFNEIQKAGKIGWYEAMIKENTFIGSYETYNIFFDEYSETAVTAEDLISALHPDDKAMFFNVVKENIVKKSTVFDWEYRVITPKKGLKHVFSRAYLEFDKNGDLVRRFGIVQDITEKKKYEEQLVLAKEKAIESDRLKSAFLANMSHEIRTPMNGIIGFSELFLHPDIPIEKKMEYANIVIDSGKQLLNIVDDILDISKIEVGQLNIVFEPVNVNVLIDELYTFYLPKANEKQLKLSSFKGVDHNKSVISTDKYRLVQVLNNLISNAFKFTKIGEIAFGYELNGRNLEFFVKDTGLGIPKEFHDAVFDRFRQTDQEIVREVGGTGLGLAISKKLVNLLGGDIALKSEVHKGTQLNFTIPYVESEDLKVLREQKNQSLKLSHASILVVEDEEINYKFIADLLAIENLHVIRAKNGIEAVEICKTNSSIKLILMDIKMPKMGGLEATKRIKEFRPTVPIIMQTAYVMEADRREAFKAGCTGFIPKPIMKDDLLNILRENL